MTIKQTLQTIKMNNPELSARYISDTKEYRITTKVGTKTEREARAYYTDDSDDAIQTACVMIWSAR